MKNNCDIIIIGGGPAGYTAALYAARFGLEPLVLEKLVPGGQMATTVQIDNYPGLPENTGGAELGERMRQAAEHSGAHTVFEAATGAELRSSVKQITTATHTFHTRAVILAMGASPRPLGLPDENSLRGKGVSYCAACDGMLYRGRTVAVAGGGDAAVADALTLSQLCKKVYLIHRRDSLRAAKAYSDQLKRASNIEFIRNARIDALRHERVLTGLSYADTVTGEIHALDCDGLFVAIGRTPDSALVAAQVDLDSAGFIKADETTRTSIPGVFAAGDIRTKPLRQIITAASDGACAAHAAETYLRSVRTNPPTL